MLIGNLIPWRNKAREDAVDELTTGSALSRFHSEVDRLFERFFEEPLWGESKLLPELRSASLWSPSLDVSESEMEITVRAEIPGVEPEDLDIAVTGNMLTISGEKKEEREERSQSVYRAERRFGSFRRSVALPDSVDTENISADYDKGVLTVHLAKSEKSAARRIPVSLKKK